MSEQHGKPVTPLFLPVDRIIRLPEVLMLTGFSRSTLYSRMNPSSKGYDPEFPRPVNLFPSSLGGGAKGWHLSEVLHWCATRTRLVADK